MRVQIFRGATATELIPFRLDDGEDLVSTLVRSAEELNLGSAAVVMGSGTLVAARLLPAGTAGPDPLGVLAEHEGPLALVSIQGWILANQPELHLCLSRASGLIAGRAMPGCRVQGSLEGLILRFGNVRLARVHEPAAGGWTLAAGPRPGALPRWELQGQTIDPRAVLKVPIQLLARYRVLPIAINGDTLIVATAHPGDLFAQDDLRLATGLRIQWLPTPADILSPTLDRVLRDLSGH